MSFIARQALSMIQTNNLAVPPGWCARKKTCFNVNRCLILIPALGNSLNAAIVKFGLSLPCGHAFQCALIQEEEELH